jgi:hypothetical protein
MNEILEDRDGIPSYEQRVKEKNIIDTRSNKN